MNNFDSQYIKSVKRVLKEGVLHDNDRTSVGTLRVWGHSFKLDLQEGFPIHTCKKAGFKNVVAELLWFISGSTNVKDLEKIYAPSVKWWLPWANAEGGLGPMYGKQYTNFNGKGLNQFTVLINRIKQDPGSRRLLLTTYNPLEAPKGALFPCHGIHTQFMVNNGVLNSYTSQRSCDLLLGLSANIPSYALLTHMIAQCCDLKVGTLIYNIADLHIYLNHIEGAKEVIRRAKEEVIHDLPTLYINTLIKNINDFQLMDFKLNNYNALPSIKLSIAV